MQELPRTVIFFATAAGNEPVREFLQDLPKNEKKIIGEDIKAAQWSNPWRKPLVDTLGQGLWEVRSTLPNTIARIIFFELAGAMILLHAFKKKTKTTPSEAIEISKKRKKEYEQNHHQKK